MSATVSREYAEDPFLMVRAHETLLKGLDSVIAQVADDHSTDVLNWFGYVSAWASCVNHHHTIEEKVLLPLFDSRGLDVHHKKLHSDFESLAKQIEAWRGAPPSYDPARLASMLEELAPNFRQHLHEEVAHLGRDRLAAKVTSDDLKKCIAELVAEAKKGDPFVEPAFMMSHTPPEHKDWSNMGCFMYRVVIPALSWRYAGYWKYAPEPLNL